MIPVICSCLGINPADAVKMAGTEIKALHIHDNLGNHDDHLVPCCGIIDWKAFVNSLHEINYDGVFSLECNFNQFLPGASVDTKLSCLREITKGLLQTKQ